MNKEYTYIDGKVIVRDSEGNQKQSEYYDNLESVLIQENIIEKMKIKIDELEEQISKIKKDKPQKYRPAYTFLLLFASLVAFAFVYLLFGNMGLKEVLANKLTRLFLFVPIPLLFALEGICMDSLEYFKYKELIKEEKGLENELDFIRRQLSKEKERLTNLKIVKSRNNESNEFRTVKLDAIEELKTLRKYLKLHYDLGCNGEDYYRYYQIGILPEMLRKQYNEEEIQYITGCLEGKDPTLILRKNKRQ